MIKKKNDKGEKIVEGREHQMKERKKSKMSVFLFQFKKKN